MRILIVKLHALGDLVIATPAIRKIRQSFKNAEIHLLTTQWSAPAVENNPNIDNMLVVPTEIFFKPGLNTAIPTYNLFMSLKN